MYPAESVQRRMRTAGDPEADAALAPRHSWGDLSGRALPLTASVCRAAVGQSPSPAVDGRFLEGELLRLYECLVSLSTTAAGIARSKAISIRFIPPCLHDSIKLRLTRNSRARVCLRHGACFQTKGELSCASRSSELDHAGIGAVALSVSSGGPLRRRLASKPRQGRSVLGVLETRCRTPRPPPATPSRAAQELTFPHDQLSVC